MGLGDQQTRSRRSGADRLVEAHAGVNRSVCALMDLIIELDTPEVRLENSVTDMASWLMFDLGLEARTARSWVRVARALSELPHIREAFRAGTVSFDEVRVLCRYATADNEVGLLVLTSETPVEELAGVIRSELAIETRRAVREHKESWLSMGWNEDDSFLWVNGEIQGVDGLLVETTLRRLATKAPLDPTHGIGRDPLVTNGEALIQMASESAADDADHDRATLVVHVDATDLANGQTAGLADDRLIDPGELRRVSCDARLQPAIDDPAGFTVGVGRTSRKIPHWLRRLINGRDQGCRFPGCGRTRWTHAHHIIHWAEDGPTNLDNLITLCGFHHRLIHRQHWLIQGNPNGEVTFLDQWGNEYQPPRSILPPGHKTQLLNYLDGYHNYRLKRLTTTNTPP